MINYIKEDMKKIYSKLSQGQYAANKIAMDSPRYSLTYRLCLNIF